MPPSLPRNRVSQRNASVVLTAVRERLPDAHSKNRIETNEFQNSSDRNGSAPRDPLIVKEQTCAGGGANEGHNSVKIAESGGSAGMNGVPSFLKEDRNGMNGRNRHF